MRILIIEDKESLATILKDVLSKTYTVVICSSGKQGFLMATRQVVTREQIISNPWNNNADFFMNTINVHMMHLRDKIDRLFEHKLIKTIHGVGYKIERYKSSLSSARS